MTTSEPHSKQPTGKSRLIREWLVKFSVNCNEALTELAVESYQQLWEESFADLSYPVLAAAFAKTIRKCKFFPRVADVRSEIDQAEAGGFTLEAEQKWNDLMRWVRRYVLPDTGISRGAPALEPAVEFAAKAANGFHWLESCPEDQLVWARKTFLERYSQIRESKQDEHLLTRSEAKEILSRLTTEALPERALSPPPTVRQASLPRPNTDDGIGAAFEEACRVVNAPRTKRRLSPEEIDRRKHEQRARLERHLQEHPELCGKLSPAEGCEPVLAPNLAEVSS